jgi:hypothetical protein
MNRSDSNANTDDEFRPPVVFTYSGRRVVIVPPDAQLVGNYWQIKIDDILQGNLLFSTSQSAADQAKRLIDRQEE